MKWKGLLLTGLLLSSFLVMGIYPNVDNKEKESMILDAVLNYINALHFNPIELDDEFSSKVFDNYIESIDPSKRFLLQQEVDQLSIYKTELDDQIKMKDFSFFNASIEIIKSSRERSKRIFKEIMAGDIAMIDEKTIQVDREKRQYSKSEADLKDLWEQLIKNDYNNRLLSKLEEQEEDEDQDDSNDLDDVGNKEAIKKGKDATMSVEHLKTKAKKDEESEEDKPLKTEAELKVEVTKKIQETYDDWYGRMDKDKRSDRFETFVNAITHLFDPHTDFYNPKEKQDFDIRMGGKLEGIGARLQTADDYTKVTSIIPGGPAWKGKELEVDDLITAVTQQGGEPVDITGMRIDDVVQKIRGKKGTVVILTVKKVDGSFADVTIERDEVIIDEGFARSLTLNVPDVMENVGYIKLPKFYSSFEKKDGNSCAKDVAAEIQKLKDLNVNGIILDLRNNGGGSLTDVVDMTGLFIEDGPIVQVKPRDKPAYVHDDTDPGVLYNGPLIVMVNQFSASASEILAAALQDYERAVIVGSTSTFGKGTVQRFVDLDRAISGANELKPLGNLKITMQKFFRINGGSTQLKGVTPDIIFPNNYHFIETGEKDYDYAMAWTEIAPVEYSQDIYKIPSITELNIKSKDRTSKIDDFNMVLDNAARLKKNRDETVLPLEFSAYRNYVDKREEEAKAFDGLYDKKIDALVISNLAIDQEYIDSDESRTARNDDWKEGVSKDFYLEETMHIMKDMIDLTANNDITKK